MLEDLKYFQNEMYYKQMQSETHDAGTERMGKQKAEHAGTPTKRDINALSSFETYIMMGYGLVDDEVVGGGDDWEDGGRCAVGKV